MLAPSRHPRGQNPVELCKLLTTLDSRRPCLCTAMGSRKGTIFIKCKAKPVLSEPLRLGGGQPLGWDGCDPKIIQTEGGSKLRAV